MLFLKNAFPEIVIYIIEVLFAKLQEVPPMAYS